MLNEILKQRDLLPILTHDDGTPVTKESWPLRRQEMRNALEVYSYGHSPDVPLKVWGKVSVEHPEAYAGKVREQDLYICFKTIR